MSVPAGREQNRIVEYRTLSNGEFQFDFNAPKGLNDIMIASLKRDAKGVWLANYKQLAGKETTGEWTMDLRAPSKNSQPEPDALVRHNRVSKRPGSP